MVKVLMIISTLIFIPPAFSQPSARRLAQIRAALASHGYPSGSTWPEVQATCREVARDHHWQTRHAPDARVLIWLGLGNKYSDAAVTEPGANHLDYEKEKR